MSYNNLEEYLVPASYFQQGGLWLFGMNSYGMLGNNSLTSQSSPVQTIAGGTNWKQVSVGRYHATGIKTDGTLWLWGNNAYGQLGNNTITHKSSPIQTISGGTNWKSISLGYYTTGAAIKTDGSLWAWGRNNNGQLGDNTIVHKSSPVQTVAGGNNWKSVSSGIDSVSAIKTDGTLWLWGVNGQGQLGNNTITKQSSPVQTVAGGNNWKQVSMLFNHTAAVKTDGTLWLWGLNTYGQLGDNTGGTGTNKSSPVQTITGGNNWKSVAVATIHTAAIKTDGTLWLWGRNAYGQLGNNATTDVSSPIQTIAGGTNWKQISTGYYFTAGLKTDGTLWTWGNNGNGNLGNNDATLTNRSSPVQTVAGGTNWKLVACNNYTLAGVNGTWGTIT